MSFNFPLLPTTTISASGVGAPTNEFGYYRDLYLMLNCSAVPTGGSPTLDVYLQTSCDGGATWQDIGHWAQLTSSTGKKFAAISGEVTGPTTAVAASDAALAANTFVQGPWGNQLRIKYVFAAGGSTGSYTLTVWVSPKVAAPGG